MAYLVGAFVGAVVLGWLIGAALDASLMRRLIADRIISISVSGLAAYVVIIALAAVGNADGGPVNLANVPLFTYGLGMATATWFRIKAHNKKLDRAGSPD